MLHLSLLLSGATRYPEVAASLHSLLASGKVNPGDVVRVCHVCAALFRSAWCSRDLRPAASEGLFVARPPAIGTHQATRAHRCVGVACVNMFHNFYIEYLSIMRNTEMLVEVLFNPEKASNTQQHKAKYVWLLAYAVSVHDTEGGPDTSQLDSTLAAIEGAQGVCQKNYLVWADMESAGVLVSAMQGCVSSRRGCCVGTCE